MPRKPRRTRAPVRLPAVSEDRWSSADDLVESWLGTKSQATLDSYTADLGDFGRYLGMRDTPTAMAALLALPAGDANRVADGYKRDLLQRPVWRSATARKAGEEPDKIGLAPATVNRRLAALRSVCSLARLFGTIAWSLEVPGVEAQAYRDTRGIPRDVYVAIRRHVELEAATAAEEGDVPGHAMALRDACILRFLMDHALRRIELLSLDWPGDIDLRHNRMWLSEKRRRRDETQKREFPLSGPAKVALKGWLELRGREPGPLFFSMSNRATRERLDKRSLSKILNRIAAAAGCPHVRPHDFRHAAITRALEKTNGDVTLVQKFSRHAKIETVMVYDDRREQKPRQVVDLVAQEDDDDGIPDETA